MKRIRSVVLAMMAVVMAGAYTMAPVTAHAASSAALSIVPRKNYTIAQGKSVKDKLIISNLDRKEPLNLSLRVVDFTYTDDGGTPKLMLAEDAPQTTWSLKPFLTVPKNVSIPAKGTKSVPIDVAIPAGHGAGSYYSAIVYSSGSSDSGNVGLSASGVTLVFTQIPGKVKEDLTLTNFGAYDHKADGGKGAYQFIATSMPEMLAYSLKNNGNVTESPVGSITLKGMFGNEQVISDVNPNKSLALIGQERTFTACIKLKAEDVQFQGSSSRLTECATPSLWPGRYEATLDIFYGQNGNNTSEIVKTVSFWYLPWWFILVFLVVLLVAIYFVWRTVNKIRARLNKPRSRRR
ncbi:MAG TPA: hypothetical protein VGE34_03795 [Candidatus Saccharimonadales bacterium]